MLPDLTLEAIYFNTSTDFKMEFKLCSICNVRFLSTTTKDNKAFLLALQKSVSRSKVIVTIGGFNKENYLPKIVANSIGNELINISESKVMNVDEDIQIPSGAVPLFNTENHFCGLVIEKGTQSIIMLTEDKELRQQVLDSLVLPYIKLIANKTPAPFVNSVKEEYNDLPNTTEQEPLVLEVESIEEVEPMEETEPIEETKLSELAEIENSQENNPTNEVEIINNDEIAVESQKEDSVAIEVITEEPKNKEIKNTEENKKILKLEDIEFGSHDKDLTNYNSLDFLHIEDDYVGKHSRKSQPDDEIQYLKLDEDKDMHFIPFDEIKDTDIKNSDKTENFTVLELPSQLDTIDELSYEVKPERKSRKVLKAIIAIILALLVILGSIFGYEYLYQPMQGDSIYNSIVSLYGKKSDSVNTYNDSSKFGKLYELNQNLIGFISIPNSNIHYPIVKTTQAGSVYCESHLFDGTYNNYGTPYTLNQISGESFNRNIVIYGKTVNTSKMFSDLKKYENLQFYRSSPVITFDTIYANNSYKIFSVMQFTEAPFDYKKNYFFSDEEFYNFLLDLKSASKLKINVDVNEMDQIITLVTKNKGFTTCVFARKVRENESPLVDVSETSLNLQADSFIQNSSENTYSGGLIDLGENDNVSEGRFEQSAPESTAEITVSDIISSSSVQNSSVISSRLESIIQSQSEVSSAESKKLPTFYVKNSSASGAKVSGNALDIIAKVVEAEMGSRYESEALKAQAICSYGWLLCSGATDGKSYPSVPMKTPSTKTLNAVKEVAGIVAVYNGKVAQTFCFDTSAGKTANASEIWGGNYPWLKSVDSSVDKNSTAYLSTRNYKASDIAKWVSAKWKDIDLTKISDKNSWFKPVYDSNNLYVKDIYIGGVKQRGSHLRTYVLNDTNCGYKNGLRSPAYTIKYNSADDTFTFTVKGYGHGVGLSQTGANEYAKAGYTYDKILKHYFTGITLGTFYADN